MKEDNNAENTAGEKTSKKKTAKKKTDEAQLPSHFSLKKILGGDMLNTSFVRRQVWLIALIALILVVCITNRYSCQQSIIKIDRLEKELKTAKFKALSSNSKLTEESRQTNILQLLQNNNDSALQLPTQPPYIITIPDE